MSTTKQQIAEVFERRVGEVGYDRTTLDDVSREMHISKKTIYVYFDGKGDIYSYVVARQAAREKMRLAASVATLPSCAARVEAVVSFVISSARAHIAETSRDEWLREYEIAADAFAQANGELLRELIAAGIEAGEFSDGDPGFLERMVRVLVLDYLTAVNEDPALDHDAELTRRILKFLS